MPLACAHRPQASDVAGRPCGPPVVGQGVEEGVGGGVVALAGAAEGAGDRGEQHERRQVEVRGQLVQVPRRVHLRREHRVDPRGRQLVDHAVVEHARGVHDRGQRMLRRHRREQPGERAAVGDVAGRHGRRLRRAPSARRRARPRPAASGPRRLASSRLRAPCSVTRCRATRPPSSPVPPVISTVPSGSSGAPAPSARSCRRAAPGS